MSSNPWTLSEAKDMLHLWMDAYTACASSQSYTIGSRSLSRANLSEIRDQIDYWRNEIAAIEHGSNGGRRVLRIIPRDL